MEVDIAPPEQVFRAISFSPNKSLDDFPSKHISNGVSFALEVEDEPYERKGSVWDDSADLVFMTDDEDGQDEKLLNTLGKKQDVKRSHSFWSLMGLTTCAMSTWVSILLSSAIALDNGGRPSMIYGFVLCWLGGLAIAASLAELSSIAPVSAGQYHWVYMLAPEKHKKFLSWFTGWVTFAGWTGNAAAVTVLCGQLVVAMIQINHDTYRPDDLAARWQSTLVGILALSAASAINMCLARWLAPMGKAMLVFQVIALLGVFVPMVVLSDHVPAEVVFMDFVNRAGWSTNGMAFMIGLSGANIALIGVDVPTHFAEETRHAAKAVPRAMFWGFFASGAVGIVMAVALAFCIGDVDGAEQSLTGWIVIDVMHRAAGVRGATACVALLVSLMFASALIFLASASRQLRGFTRDNGLPGSPWLKELNTIRGTPTPLRCILLSALISLVFDLVNIASSEAFISLTSLTIGGLGLSFMIPIVLITMKRIMPVQGEGFAWGRWVMNIFGYEFRGLGLAVNIIAIISLVTSTIFSFFPLYLPISAETTNWSAPALAVMIAVGIVYWFCHGRRVYRGVVHEQDCFSVPVAIFL